MKAVVNAQAVLPGAAGFVAREDMAILYDARLEKIMTMQAFAHLPFTGEVYDAAGAYVAPGFLNLHIHGCAGWDTMDADARALPTMAAMQASHGVTGFLPTTMTYDMPTIHAALGRVRTAMQAPPSGARVLGANMEGPFISPAYKGSQKESNIQRADFAASADDADVVKIITIAPEELHGDYSFVYACRAAGIRVAMGHTAADYATAREAIAHGVQHVTHLFNAQTGLHHREPGVVGAALDSEVLCELITDNVHVHPAAQRIVWRAKGGQGIVLVTDSLRACGLGDGESELGGQRAFVKGRRATLADGTIAASVLALNDGVRIFRDNVGIPTAQAVELVTRVPATALGLEDRCGTLEVGKQADMTIFDEQLQIRRTIIGGETCYEQEAKANA